MSIALERFILPGRVSDSQQAYIRALERVCTTLTKGFFREFVCVFACGGCVMDVMAQALLHYPLVKNVDKDLMRLYRDEILPIIVTLCAAYAAC